MNAPARFIKAASPKPRTLSRYQELREAGQQRLERPFVRGLAAVFRRQRDLLVPAIRKFGVSFQARVSRQSDADDIVVRALDVLRRTNPSLERIFRTSIGGALRGARVPNGGLVHLSGSVNMRLFNASIRDFLDDHIPFLTVEVSEETLRRISHSTMRVIEQGKTVDDLAKTIGSMFTDMAKTRALTIAQTEIGIAQSTGDFIAAQSMNMDLVKIWSNSQDERVRPTHQIREVRDIHERFSNGLLYPLEAGAPAAEVIRCRCTILWSPRAEAAGTVGHAHGDG